LAWPAAGLQPGGLLTASDWPGLALPCLVAVCPRTLIALTTSRERKMNTEAELKLALQAGDTLKHENHRMKGSLMETDIDTYSVLNAAGEKVGSVIHTDHTAQKGFRRTQNVEQRDASGKIIVDVSW
jgi:hypothetical protein